jgi:hypothetical protein
VSLYSFLVVILYNACLLALSTVCTPTKTLGTDSPYTSACGMISPESELFSHISQPVPISPVRSSTQLPSRLLPPPPHIDNFVLHVSTNTFSSIPLKEGGDDNIGSLNGEACHTSLKPFQPNCRQAIPFENNFFVGQILFVVRTKPLDPFYKHFFEHSKDRMYIIQLQGRFKKPPRNASSLFMGKFCPFVQNCSLFSVQRYYMLLYVAGDNRMYFSCLCLIVVDFLCLQERKASVRPQWE